MLRVFVQVRISLQAIKWCCGCLLKSWWHYERIGR